MTVFVPCSKRQWSASNKGRIPRSHTVDAGVRMLAKIARNLGLGGAVEVAKSLGLKKAVRSINTRQGTGSLEEMSLEIRAMLYERFREENAKLSDLIGRDLTFWK